jgi:hypothetical protein
MFTSRSRTRTCGVLRNVTLQPIGWPSRTLNVAMDFRAFVITAFWPAISPRSLAADSTFLRSFTPSPMPHIDDDLLDLREPASGSCIRIHRLVSCAPRLRNKPSDAGEHVLRPARSFPPDRRRASRCRRQRRRLGPFRPCRVSPISAAFAQPPCPLPAGPVCGFFLLRRLCLLFLVVVSHRFRLPSVWQSAPCAGCHPRRRT